MDTASTQQGFSADELVELVQALGTGGACCPVVVRGTSMQPTLKDAIDTVYLRALEPDEAVRAGDVVFFHRDSQVVLHRVIAELPGGMFRINGDNQLWSEDVPRSAIFARAERVGRAGRSCSLTAGPLHVWGLLWLRLLPLRSLLWRLPQPLKHLVGCAGERLKGRR